MIYSETVVLEAMQKFEGFTFAEAKLTHAKREKLPSSAFCGPKRTYPSQDAAHVRNALARLSQFGHKLKKSVRDSIFACLRRRAKRFKIEIEETVSGKLCLILFDESLDPKKKDRWQKEFDAAVKYESRKR